MEINKTVDQSYSRILLSSGMQCCVVWWKKGMYLIHLQGQRVSQGGNRQEIAGSDIGLERTYK
jgi:hypothetical protein